MKYTVKIGGMMCGHCVAHVKEALEAIGATDISVMLDSGTAEFKLDKPEEAIYSAIEGDGYIVLEVNLVKSSD